MFIRTLCTTSPGRQTRDACIGQCATTGCRPHSIGQIFRPRCGSAAMHSNPGMNGIFHSVQSVTDPFHCPGVWREILPPASRIQRQQTGENQHAQPPLSPRSSLRRSARNKQPLLPPVAHDGPMNHTSRRQAARHARRISRDSRPQHQPREAA